jgi:hypothetical protein
MMTIGNRLDVRFKTVVDKVYALVMSIDNLLPKGKLGRWWFFKITTPVYHLSTYYFWAVLTAERMGNPTRIYGFDFGDLRVEIPTRGLTLDFDIADKRDIFIFSTAIPYENIKFSVRWDSHPHRLLKTLMRAKESE